MIGTSTRGPNALHTVLTKFPENLPIPIVIVQHIPPWFTSSLANRLNGVSKITVKEAGGREILQDGTGYIALGGFHLTLRPFGKSVMTHLEQGSKDCIHCPSVDQLFMSAAQLKDYGKIAVIITGMGSDGTKGPIALKGSAHVKAIAESKENSVVFGIPKAANATGLIDETKDVEHISETVMKYL
ncbi:CheB methylesterase domain-containing protein [Niallia sp. XMNu-256]|uniref:CheB methylesterase domain-containing protein n=1 Tax=Niallia sp. XMNu-256 TaxID=3082444 RepID=UPI0030D5DCB7